MIKAFEFARDLLLMIGGLFSMWCFVVMVFGSQW